MRETKHYLKYKAGLKTQQISRFHEEIKQDAAKIECLFIWWPKPKFHD